MTTLASIVINHQSLLLLYDLQNGNNNNAIDTHILHNHIVIIFTLFQHNLLLLSSSDGFKLLLHIK